VLWLQHRPDKLRVAFGPDTRASELLIGCAAAVLVVLVGEQVRASARATKWVRAGATLGAIVVALHLPIFQAADYTFGPGYTLVSLGTASVLVAIVAAPGVWWQRLLELRPLRWIGRVSYGLYLWHFVVFHVIDKHPLGQSGPTVVVMKFAATFAVAALSYRLVEKPFLARKARFAPQAEMTALAAP
jgi:peptidoglycan/LPS O-acetylase OafA/YrhL